MSSLESCWILISTHCGSICSIWRCLLALYKGDSVFRLWFLWMWRNLRKVRKFKSLVRRKFEAYLPYPGVCWPSGLPIAVDSASGKLSLDEFGELNDKYRELELILQCFSVVIHTSTKISSAFQFVATVAHQSFTATNQFKMKMPKQVLGRITNGEIFAAAFQLKFPKGVQVHVRPRRTSLADFA